MPLDENNFDDIKQILQDGTFKGSDGKEIKKMLPVLLNTNYIQDLLIKKSKSTKIYESHTDFFLDSIPDIAHEVA